MNEKQICDQCKRPIDVHTRNELFSCRLEIAKRDNPHLTDEEVTEYFDKIKSGEYYRMRGNSKQKNQQN